jgi:site-specific recombinase XerD
MPKKSRAKRGSAKNVLRLPDLDHSKASVLQSLGSAASRRTYAFAINDFITWYCSEPRLAFGRTVVLRYRYELVARRLAPATINLRLAAVRRLAYEASDNGLLSPDLAASIRRVKGAKKLGTRLGNWLTCAQGRRLLEAPDKRDTKGKRDHAILALLLGCGLRRAELIGLKLAHLQQRDDHWAIIDLFGKVSRLPAEDHARRQRQDGHRAGGRTGLSNLLKTRLLGSFARNYRLRPPTVSPNASLTL